MDNFGYMLNKKYFYLDDAVAFLNAETGGDLYSKGSLVDQALQNRLPLFIKASNWQMKSGLCVPFYFDRCCPIDICTLEAATQSSRILKGEMSYIQSFSIKIDDAVETVLFPSEDMIILESDTPTSCPFALRDLVIKLDTLLELIELYYSFNPVDESFAEILPLPTAPEISCPPSTLTSLAAKQDALIVLDSFEHGNPLKVTKIIASEYVTIRLPTEESSQPNIFRKNKTGTWDFKFNGQDFPSLPNRIGFSYIQHLLKNPHKDIYANALSSLLSKTVEIYEPEAISALIDEGLSVTKLSNAGQCIDSVAIKQYKMRMEELKDLIEEACESDDIEAAENYREEFDVLASELRQNTTSKGKPKTDKSDTRKISQAVSRSIKNAINEINNTCPDLAEHLTAYINKGKECEYKPPLSTEWSF